MNSKEYLIPHLLVKHLNV